MPSLTQSVWRVVAALAPALVLLATAGCGGGDSAAPSASSSSRTTSTEDPTRGSSADDSASTDPTTGPSALATDARSRSHQVLEVKDLLSRADVKTIYAHARVTAEVAQGEPGGFNASGRLDLLSDPERFSYAIKFPDQDFVGTFVSVDGKVYAITANGSGVELPEDSSRYMYYWLNPLLGAHSLERGLDELTAVRREELGLASTTHYSLTGVLPAEDLRYTADIWVDADGHVRKRVFVLPEITVTMEFDDFDHEVTIDRPDSGNGTTV